jgi:hypothetical protein
MPKRKWREKRDMTNLQMVKALDAQIEASFKRSASNPEEARLRNDIREIQDTFRRAHKAKVYDHRIRAACINLLRAVTPEMAEELRPLMRPMIVFSNDNRVVAQKSAELGMCLRHNDPHVKTANCREWDSLQVFPRTKLSR